MALATLPTVPFVASVACGNGGTGGVGGTTGASPNCNQGQVCFPWPDPGTGSSTSSAASGTTSSSATSTASGTSSASGSSTGSSMMPACPTVQSAPASWKLTPTGGCNIVTGPISNTAGMCCYQFVRALGTGRPFIEEEKAIAAPAQAGRNGAWIEEKEIAPRVTDLTEDERARLARAWTDDGLLEHASIASFGRFALELMAVGAPADLIERAHQAALDEARHTRLCLTLASAYAGRELEPGAFPFRGRVEVDDDLGRIAARVALEGCVGETLAAVEAAERASAASDPAVRAALTAIAADEANHAELAWRTVAWALRVGGADVRAAVQSVFATLGMARETSAAPTEETRLLAHGVLGPAHRSTVHDRALRDVVHPAANALLS